MKIKSLPWKRIAVNAVIFQYKFFIIDTCCTLCYLVYTLLWKGDLVLTGKFVNSLLHKIMYPNSYGLKCAITLIAFHYKMNVFLPLLNTYLNKKM